MKFSVSLHLLVDRYPLLSDLGQQKIDIKKILGRWKNFRSRVAKIKKKLD